LSKKSRKRDDVIIVGAAAHAAVIERLKRRTMGAGSFSAPCLPSLAEHYVAKALKLFDVLDRPVQGAELTSFRNLMKDKLQEGYRTSPHTRFILSYGPDASNPLAVAYSMSLFVPTLEQQIDEWVENTKAKEPFGTHADAKVLDVVAGLVEAGPVRILDVGAGTGRNCLPLARRGLVVDAIEPVTHFAEGLRKVAAAEKLPLSVLEADVLSESAALSGSAYQLIVLSEVVTHFTVAELKIAMPKLARALGPGGSLLFNAFVAKSGYDPDPLAREASSSVWSTFVTRGELGAITQSVGLALLTDEPAIEYEKAHLPAESWPPTPWYASWAQGENLFRTPEGVPPVELRWLLYRHLAG
jgi:SAM-dependent methyltransferase